MPTITPINFFGSVLVLFFLKIAILILLVFYAIFALLIVRQVNLMAKTLITGLAPIINIFAIVHAFFAIGLIFLVLVIL